VCDLFASFERRGEDEERERVRERESRERGESEREKEEKKRKSVPKRVSAFFYLFFILCSLPLSPPLLSSFFNFSLLTSSFFFLLLSVSLFLGVVAQRRKQTENEKKNHSITH
jgi:hypothetical protein